MPNIEEVEIPCGIKFKAMVCGGCGQCPLREDEILYLYDVVSWRCPECGQENAT